MSQKLLVNTLIYGGGDFLVKFIAFLLFPLIAASLAVEEFGVLELLLTVVGLLGFVVRCGINNSVQRYYWDAEAEHHQEILLSTAFVLLVVFSLASVIFSAVLYPLLPFFSKSISFNVETVAFFSVVGLVFTSQPLQFFLDTLRLKFMHWRFIGFNVFSRVCTVVLALLVVLNTDLGVNGYLLALFVATLVTLPVGYLLSGRVSFVKFDFEWAKKILVFGYPFIAMEMAYWLFSSMDRWMLASIAGVEQTGVFAVAARFSMVVMFVSTAFGMAWSPFAIKYKTENPQSYKRFYAEVFIVFLFVLLCVAFVVSLFSKELIYLLMPEDYAGSVNVLVVLSFCAVVQGAQQLAAAGISLEKKTYLLARLAWVAAGINFILNYLLIEKFGASGAAVASLIASGFLTVSYFYCSQRLHYLPFPWWRILWLIAVAVFAFAVSIHLSAEAVTVELAIYKFIGFMGLIVLMGLSIFSSLRYLVRA